MRPKETNLSSGPWKVAIGVNEAMENWLVASLGMCRDHGDEVIYVTTDHVHASDAVCYPFEDAEFIVKCRNYAHKHGDPIERILELERKQSWKCACGEWNHHFDENCGDCCAERS